MDGCSQMVFCTHLSDASDRARERMGERERELEREKEKGKEVFNDCIVSTLQPRKRLALFKCSSACSASSTLCAFPV